ncbi:MAG: DUF3764 family protein [Pelagibacterales bacterium]|nr:DUF3764 family protein [Alphaproteobacteria bacterium]MBL6862198.1 DUF3764 family protein [Pelagibacterales bacterium]
MYVMLTQKLSNGFVSWKNMLHDNKAKLEEHGMTCIFASSHKEDDNTMMVVIHFENQEGMMGFKNDAELTKAREDAGALTETTVMTPLSEEGIVNFPKAI